MPLLSNHQKLRVAEFREMVRDDHITVVSLTKSGSGNAYGEGVTQTEVTQEIDCVIGFPKSFVKSEGVGGYAEGGDVRVVCGSEHSGSLMTSGAFLRYGSSEYAVSEFHLLEETSECLIIGKRRT